MSNLGLLVLSDDTSKFGDNEDELQVFPSLQLLSPPGEKFELKIKLSLKTPYVTYSISFTSGLSLIQLKIKLVFYLDHKHGERMVTSQKTQLFLNPS